MNRLMASVLAGALLLAMACSKDERGRAAPATAPVPEAGKISKITAGPLETHLVPDAVTIVEFYSDG